MVDQLSGGNTLKVDEEEFGSEFPLKKTELSLSYYKHTDEIVRLVWLVQTHDNREGFHVWQVCVDAITGDTMRQNDLVKHATYRALDWDIVDPFGAANNRHVGFVFKWNCIELICPNRTPENTVLHTRDYLFSKASPNGWLPSGSSSLEGPNAFAYADISSPDGYNAGDVLATPTSFNTWNYNAFFQTQEPSTYVKASIVQVSSLPPIFQAS